MLSPGPIPRSARKKFNRSPRPGRNPIVIGGLFECNQNRAIICILICWLILTIYTYQQIYGSNESQTKRSKGSIPLHQGDALNVFGHLTDKINEHEKFLSELGIDAKDSSNGEHISAETPRPTPSPTTKPTAKPTAKPTEQKEEDKVVDHYGMIL